MKIGTEIFNAVKGFGYLVELYKDDGTGPMANPDLASYVYAKDKTSEDSIMIRLPEENEANKYPEVVIYKSEGIDDKFKKLLMTIKNIALSYGNTITIRQFGKNIEPKDLAYLPKAKKEMEMTAGVNESINLDESSYFYAVDKNTGDLLHKFSDKKEASNFHLRHPNCEIVDKNKFNKEYGWINDMVEANINETKMPVGVIKHKQKLANMNDDELANYLKDKTEDQVKRLQNSHCIKNNRYLNIWTKHHNKSDQVSTTLESSNIKMPKIDIFVDGDFIGSTCKAHSCEEAKTRYFLKNKTLADMNRIKCVVHNLEEDVVPFKGKPENELKWFSTSSGHIELQIRLKDAKSAYHSGDCFEDIAELLKKPYIAEQMSKLNPELIKEQLKEYGAWDDEELKDEEMNKTRLLWLACGDIVEQEFEKMNESSEKISITHEPWFIHTIRETPDYMAAKVKFGIVLQNKKTGRSVFFQGDGETQLEKELEELSPHSDDLFNHYVSQYETIMEDVVPFPNTSKKPYPFIDIWIDGTKKASTNSCRTCEEAKEAYAKIFEISPDRVFCVISDEDKPAGELVPFKKPAVNESSISIPGCTLPNDEQQLLYDFVEKYTRPAELAEPRKEKVNIRIKDGNVEIKDKRLTQTWKGQQSNELTWRVLGNEDMVLGKAFRWAAEKEQVAESTKYKKYGSSRSSYHVDLKEKKAKVIIRHSKKIIDETIKGVRSRNVKNLYVESLNGERRLIETKSLMCARALANHINHGGMLFDDTANKIISLSEDIKKIRHIKKKYPVSEDQSNVKVHESVNNILEGLVDLMKEMNTNKISTLAEALKLNDANVAFAKAFYSERLGENYDTDALGRGSVLYTKSKKFLPR